MTTTTIGELIGHLSEAVPLSWQEAYDNSGLITGDVTRPVTGALLCLDCTEAVVEEAQELGCNVIIAHHPILFKGMRRLTGANYVERTIIQAVKHDIAIYAAHTNWDNYHLGVNRKIADKLHLHGCRVLAPKENTLLKLVTYVPHEAVPAVLEALFQAGAGKIGQYDHCSFQQSGTGTFRPSAGASPTIGTPGQNESVAETRIEVLVPAHRKNKVMAALLQAHPYEAVAHYLTPLANANQEIGSGLMGTLEAPVAVADFLQQVKAVFKAKMIKHTVPPTELVQKIAICGGSGSFLFSTAQAQGADVFISSDFKYHEFFDAESTLIADIGHYESEQFTVELYANEITKKFTTFAVNFSKINTNPIRYI